MPKNLRFSSLIAWLGSILSGLLGLLSLIALSIAAVWPVWYLATNHTRVYSFVLLLLAGVSVVVLFYARVRKHFRTTGRYGKRIGYTDNPQPGPVEQEE